MSRPVDPPGAPSPDLAPPRAEDALFMRRALGLARRAERRGEVPVGAVVVCAGRVVAGAHNGPIGARDPTGHAEIRALRRAAARLGNYRLPGCTLYVTLEPCTMCAGALVHARVERVVFGAADPKSGALGGAYWLFDRPAFNHRYAVTGGVLADPAALLLRGFFAARR